jgi:cytochrome b subunit of formate dehydrogenase
MDQHLPSGIIPEYQPHIAWDAPTRLFHWINALAVFGLIGTGLVILNDDALGLSSAGKILEGWLQAQSHSSPSSQPVAAIQSLLILDHHFRRAQDRTHNSFCA